MAVEKLNRKRAPRIAEEALRLEGKIEVNKCHTLACDLDPGVSTLVLWPQLFFRYAPEIST